VRHAILRPPLLGILLLMLALPACGIRFLDDFEGTELIENLRISGDFVVNGQLVVSIEVNNAYPVPVRVACMYDRETGLSDEEKRIAFHDRAIVVGERILEPRQGTKPSDDVENVGLSFQFSVPQPGSYFIACITPASPENGIGRSFIIRDASGAGVSAR
jgi:hypothetical protein